MEKEITKEEIDDFVMKDWIQGVLDKGENQIRLELEDYWNLMEVNQKVVYMITNGKMSKPNYTFEAIKKVYEEEKLEEDSD